MTDTTTDRAARSDAGTAEVLDHWIDGKPAAGASDRTGPVYDPARGVVQREVRYAYMA